MPIYEYRRPDGTTFEVMQSMSESALEVDPDTGVPVQRVLHAPAIHFKGKGFYNTDYGTKRRNRELKESADSGADKTEAKAKEKAKTASSSSDSASSGSSSSSDSGSTSSSSSASSDKKSNSSSPKSS
jgi:putative FmdB family regulatory protein